MKNILIVGTGGLAHEFTSWFSDYYKIVGYLGLDHSEHSPSNLPGVLYKDLVTPNLVGTDLVVVAIGIPSVKARIYEKFTNLGFKFPSIIHPSSIVSDNLVVQEGVVISPNCVVSPNVTLNKLSYLNFCCGIGHNAVIGSFVQINPGSQLGGLSNIGEGTLVGSGSTVLQGVKVGAKATIGSGSVVFSKVDEGITVMGNPAKRVRTFES